MSAKKGFLIFDALLACAVLIMFGTGITYGNIIQQKMADTLNYRLEALNYAGSAADMLRERIPLTGDTSTWPPAYQQESTLYKSLNVGFHDASSDPSICSLPDTYFRNILSGSLSYKVSDTPIEHGLVVRKVEITVSWKNQASLGTKYQEVLWIVVAIYKA